MKDKAKGEINMAIFRKEKARYLPAHLRRKILKLPRRKHHELQHKVRKYGISRRTFYYMKEYGPRVNIVHEIVKDSLKVLMPAAILASVGGVGIQSIEAKLALFLPLLVLIPSLSHIIGSFGTIVSSKFTTALYLGKVRGHPLKSPSVHRLYHMVAGVAVIVSLYIGMLASVVAFLKGYDITVEIAAKVVGTALLSTALLTGIVFALSVILGSWIFRKKEDPNNFLIPIITSVADFATLLLVTALVAVYF